MPRELLFNSEIASLFAQLKYEVRVMLLGGSTGSGGGSGGFALGQTPQKKVAGDTTESTVYTTGEITSLLDNLNNIRAWGLPSKDFFVTQTDPTSSAVTVLPGEWDYTNGQPPLVYAGATSPTISAPVGGDRYDLLTINSSGDLAWISGTTSGSPSMPAFPAATSGQIPIWSVYARSSGSIISNVDDGSNHYLDHDYRPFIGGPTVFPSTGSAYIDYQWYADGALSVVNGINGIHYVPDDFTLAGSFGYLGTTPSSGSVVVGIEYSVNNGVNWTSIYSGPQLTILSGDEYGESDPDALTLVTGTLIRANISDVGGGSAANLSINLYGTIRSASGGGTVGGVSVNASDGIVGSVTNPNTNPSISLSLGDITPDSVTSAGAVSGSNLSGTNTGDQTITLAGDATGSGDSTITVDISDTGVVAGSYTLANVTVGSDGRLLEVSSGSGTASIYQFPPEDIGSSASAGVETDASAGDHIHRGLTGIIPGTGDIIYGIANVLAGDNVSIVQSSGSFTISASSGSGGGSVTFASIAESNAGVLTNVAVNPAGLPLRVESGALIHNQSYGGNARGANAVDLQSSRTLATEVASGGNSVIAGGANNTIAGTYSFIGSGYQNEITNDEIETYSAIAGGDANVIQAGGSFIGGGHLNNIETGGYSSVISGGEQNLISASAPYASIPGGVSASATNAGQVVSANGLFANTGDAQGTIQMVLRREIDHSIDTGFQDLYLDGESVAMSIPTDSVWTVDILISAATIGLTGRANYRIVGAVANISGTAQIDAQTVTSVFETTAGWNVQLAVSGATLVIQVTDGSDTETIRWVATIRTSELTYPA